MRRIGLWNNMDHRTWFPRQQVHWIIKDDTKTWFWINTTASTFVRYKTVKKTYTYENRCPRVQKQKDKIKILNSHDAKILFLTQAYAANKSVVILCLLPLKNLTVISVHFTFASLHVWRKLVMMQLHATDSSWHNDTELNGRGGGPVRFSWQTWRDTRKHSKFYGATCHFRHHCLWAKENNTKQTGDTERAR